MDEELKRYLDEKFERMAEKFERMAEVFATEIGSLHTQIANVEERLTARIDAVEARQRHDAGLTTTLMDLVLKQTRWDEQSDNAVADLAVKHADLSRRLGDQGRRKAS